MHLLSIIRTSAIRELLLLLLLLLPFRPVSIVPVVTAATAAATAVRGRVTDPREFLN